MLMMALQFVAGKVVHGWKGGETVIIREMSRSKSRRILRNGKPQDYRNESLLMPLVNPQRECFSWEEMKGEGGETFGATKYFLITSTLWNNKPFVPENVCRSYWRCAIKGLTSRDRIDMLKGVMKDGCGAIITFVKNKLR